MNSAIIDLWADIGSEEYWQKIIGSSTAFVPFKDRWPQPGFIGEGFSSAPRRIVVMGQNPRASNTAAATAPDRKMFELIKRHAEIRTDQSLQDLFRFARGFMQSWRPIGAVNKHLGLSLDSIAYLNLIPLATHGDLIHPDFGRAFSISTAKQLEVLQPHKIVFYGKGAFERFGQLSDFPDVNYIEQRNFTMAPAVKTWLRQ